MKENLITVSVEILEQEKIDGKWKTIEKKSEKWSLEKVKNYMSDDNIKAWKNASKQRIEKNYTQYGYLPTKYYNTEKSFGIVRRVMTFNYDK